MKRLLTAQASAVALLLAFSTGAEAANLPPSSLAWSYDWKPGNTPGFVYADGKNDAGISMTNEPTKVAVGNSDIVATNLRVNSFATAAAPDLISGPNGNYSLTLTLSLNDGGTPISKSLTFNGTLNGTLSAEAAQIFNAFTGDKKQSVDLGAYKFEVEMIGYVGPGPKDQENAGSISAHVTISRLTPAQVPEPSTMLLSALGLTFLGGAAWRKRRAAKKAE